MVKRSILVLLVLAGCVRSEASYISKNHYAALAKGCPVNAFPSTTPDYAWEDLASVEAKCTAFPAEMRA